MRKGRPGVERGLIPVSLAPFLTLPPCHFAALFNSTSCSSGIVQILNTSSKLYTLTLNEEVIYF